MNLKNGIVLSLIAHVAFILIMVLKVVFYPSEALDLSQAMRVDMVDLPDRIQSAPLPPPPPPEPATEEPKEEKKEEVKKPEPKPEPKAEKLPPKVDAEAIKLEKAKKEKERAKEAKENEKKLKSKQDLALKKLKALSALDKIKNEAAKEQAEEERRAAIAEAQKNYKGRVISAGTALTGLDKLQSDSYLTQLDAKIKASWALPQWLIGKPYRTRVLVKFDTAGRILSKKVVQASGQPTYDEYCLLAIDKAAPFPPVPDKFGDVYRVDGVVIGFPD